MQAEDIVNSVVRLYALPKSYQDLRKLKAIDNVTSDGVANCLLFDPALTAQVLRIANSSLYNRAKKIDTVSRAVTLIGQESIFNLVLASSVIQKFSQHKLPVFDFDYFWEHSIRTATVAQAIAAKCNVLHTQSYFIAGLMHDIGTMVINSALPDIARALYMPLPSDMSEKHEVEAQSLGFTHADVGGALMEKWAFPDHLVDAVRYHHNPENAPRSSLSAAFIQIACAYSRQSGDEVVNFVDPFSWEVSNLNPELMEEIRVELADVLPEVIREFTHQAA